MDNSKLILYEERQYFHQYWLWAIMVISIIPVIMVDITLINELQKDTADMSMSRAEAYSILAMANIPTFGIMILFFYTKLETIISNEFIQYRLFPLNIKWHQIQFKEIKNSFVRQYKPIKEFGGWGIRFGIGIKAYNVKGNMGLQIELESGKKILIGTQNPNEITNTLKKISENGRINFQS